MPVDEPASLLTKTSRFSRGGVAGREAGAVSGAVPGAVPGAISGSGAVSGAGVAPAPTASVEVSDCPSSLRIAEADGAGAVDGAGTVDGMATLLSQLLELGGALTLIFGSFLRIVTHNLETF